MRAGGSLRDNGPQGSTGPILQDPMWELERPRDGGQIQTQALTTRLIMVLRQVKTGIPPAGWGQDQTQAHAWRWQGCGERDGPRLGPVGLACQGPRAGQGCGKLASPPCCGIVRADSITWSWAMGRVTGDPEGLAGTVRAGGALGALSTR